MKSVLSMLYDGEIFPSEQYSPKTKEYRELRGKQYMHYYDFIVALEELDASLARRFEKIMDEQLDTLPLEFTEMFIDGFSLGARMMIEVFQNPAVAKPSPSGGRGRAFGG